MSWEIWISHSSRLTLAVAATNLSPVVSLSSPSQPRFLTVLDIPFRGLWKERQHDSGVGPATGSSDSQLVGIIHPVDDEYSVQLADSIQRPLTVFV